jgi:YgiT-type zinc finger domain-containing protein
MLDRTISHVEFTDDETPIVFRDVPATVCDQCGETAMAGAVVDEIERLIEERPCPARTIEVAVYELAGVRAAEQVPS